MNKGKTYIKKGSQLHHHHGLAGLQFRTYRHCKDLGVDHCREAGKTRTKKTFFFFF